MLLARLLLIVVLLAAAEGYAESEYTPEAGDIIFQVSRSSQSQAIQIATHSRYSHCGVILPDSSGDLSVLEAIQPVTLTPLDAWINRGNGRHYVVKRLIDSPAPINDSTTTMMQALGDTWLNRDYDVLFDWSDSMLYCSELVWKIYDRVLGIELSPLRKLRDFDLTHPVVQEKLKQRYGENIPYDEPVVAPSDLFDSDRLREVARGGSLK